MFQFLTPIWLFGAAALLIPVLIHLWNIRSGKVLKVGSISLIEAASRKSSRSFKLLDIPLFLLRCLLLLLLALFLSLPVLQKKLMPVKEKGWILIPKEHFSEVYQKFKPAVDSLNKAGYVLHYFNTGFPQSNLTQVLLHPKDSLAGARDHAPTLYWDLVRQLDNKVASDLPVYIFTSGQSRHFQGAKPQIALNLHWQTYTPADSAATWIAKAWFTNNNAIRVAQVSSSPAGTSYTYANVQAGNQSNSSYAVSVDNGRPTVGIKNSSEPAQPVDTAAMRIAVYADNNSADAGYLKAALQAVSQFTQRKTIIRQYADPAKIPAGQSWIFWLSEKPLSSRLVQQSANVLQYEKGKVISANSWLDNGGQFYTTSQQPQKLNLYKLITPSGGSYAPVWKDGFGNPVLGLQQKGNTHIYHFYSRFSSPWSDLVWSDKFPEWLLKLLYTQNITAGNHDKSVLSPQQIMPELTSETHTVEPKTTDTVDLSHYFWLALIIVFAFERWLASRTPKLAINERA